MDKVLAAASSFLIVSVNTTNRLADKEGYKPDFVYTPLEYGALLFALVHSGWDREVITWGAVGGAVAFAWRKGLDGDVRWA